jgi:tetratricopeptide (TPR) repeat protein
VSARSDFRQLLQYFPGDSYGKTQLAMVEAKLEDVSKQERNANVEQQSKQKSATMRQSALDLFASGAYAKSIAAWQEYLKLEPKSDDAWFYIGASYQNQKQLDTAITNFEKCLALNPKNILAHLNIGLLYDYHRKDYRAAEEHLRMVKELGGTDRFTPEQLDATIQGLRERSRSQEIAKLAIPVEHKHTFSSCRGTLHFSEEGMEFRTGASDHSFYEAWKGMKDFVIEGATLTLKTRRDRKYNFRFLNQDDARRIREWSSTLPAIPATSERGQID